MPGLRPPAAANDRKRPSIAEAYATASVRAPNQRLELFGNAVYILHRQPIPSMVKHCWGWPRILVEIAPALCYVQSTISSPLFDNLLFQMRRHSRAHGLRAETDVNRRKVAAYCTHQSMDDLEIPAISCASCVQYSRLLHAFYGTPIGRAKVRATQRQRPLALPFAPRSQVHGAPMQNSITPVRQTTIACRALRWPPKLGAFLGPQTP